ncbi:MAG: hypothetical protein IPJ84_04565 [Bdellovibrionales bacterium]|nr:hypothetical protein [Bdellovibrionales bacterium]
MQRQFAILLLPIVFILTTAGAEDAQNPEVSPSFTSHDLSIPSDAGGGVGICHLGATFLTPKKEPARALILLIHGSGTSDRNEQTPDGHHPFKDIAENLAKNGFATLRFDKRGLQPECRPSLTDNPQLSPWAFIQDVQNIISFTQGDNRMKELPLVLLGHSEESISQQKSPPKAY